MRTELWPERALEPRLHVGIGDCALSDAPDTVLITHALGSCIAVVLHDPVTHVTGLLHYMLPDSGQADETTRLERPYLYADTGIPRFFKSAYALGAHKQRLIVSLIGGAQVLSQSDAFHVGKRNYLAARKLFWRAGVLVHAEDVGGVTPRTVRVQVNSGQIVISLGQNERILTARKGAAHGL